MTIRIKHRQTEIEVIEIKTISHNLDLINLLEAISKEIQAIENNYENSNAANV